MRLERTGKPEKLPSSDPQAGHWPAQTHSRLGSLRAISSSDASGDEPNRLSVRINLKALFIGRSGSR